jgi:enediyne biosynthesis protein E4
MIRWPLLLAVACSTDGESDGGPTDSTTRDSSTTTTGGTIPTPESADTATTATTVPTSFEATFLWAPITFVGAVDYGAAVGPIDKAAQVEPGPAMLAEVTLAAGLSTSSAGGNSHGVGIGFFDADGDSWEDILVASGKVGASTYMSSLWHNNGDGTFTDVSTTSGVGPALSNRDTYSVAAADYDADGDLDVLIGAQPMDILLQNQGDGTFVDVTTAAGVGGPQSTSDPGGSSKIGAWGDYNGDGWMDYVVASSTFNNNDRNAYLMQNDGDGTFTDVSATSDLQISTSGNPCAVIWTDYDNDGDQDLNIWNDRGNATTNRTLLRNDKGMWVDATVSANMTNSVGNPMGIDGADIDRNGFLDYYLGNIGGNPLMMQQNGQFVDYATSAGVRADYGWGLGFEDLNADTWWDIFVAQEDTRPYLTFIHDRNIPPTFTEREWAHPAVSTGHNVPVAFADFDHDFDVDVVSGNTDGQPLVLYRNDTDRGTNQYLEVEVARSPGVGEFGGVSGRVVVKVGDTVLWRDLTGGSSRASQNAMSVRFGLGQYTGAEWVAVLWPDGRELSALNVPGNTKITLSAP